jgi:CPA2 family monovalent cation:H+ antiporter-2
MGEHPQLLIEIGVVLVVLSLLAQIARRIGLSPIPFYLLAGLPFSGWLTRSSEAGLSFIEGGAQIGAVLLLLALGLEFNVSELTAGVKRHAPSGLVDFVLNAGAGAIAGVLMGMDLIACVALAGITWTSSSGMVARLLEDLGRLGNRETPAVLSVLVIEDLAMAVYLPLVSVLLAGGSAVQAALAALAAVGFVALLLVVAPRIGGPLGRILVVEDREQVLLRVMGVTLVFAGLTGYLDASAAVGAFIVGLTIPGAAAERARRIILPLRDLFAAVFFFAFGLSIDTGQFGPAIVPAVLLVVVTSATKMATGWYAARRDGVGTRGRLRAGAVLLPRGEFSVVIAGLAAVEGNMDLPPLAAAYVLILAVIGPVIARFADDLVRRPSSGARAVPRP